MTALRNLLAVSSLALLAAGYLGSQYAYFQGNPSAYAAAVDAPAVRLIAALFLVSALVLSFIKEGDPQQP